MCEVPGFPVAILRLYVDEFVALNESEIADVSTEEASGESAFAEVPDPSLERAVEEDHDVEAEAKPVNDDWGMPTPVKTSKKTKKGQRAL
jgi:hypothetical protein